MIERSLAIARLHGLDLLRRRLVVVMLAAFPLLLYATMERDTFAIVMVGTLMNFSIAGPGIFVALTGKSIDARLLLAGFRPIELAAGRCLLLAASGLVVVSALAAVVVLVSAPDFVPYLLIGLGAMALIAVPFGLVLGSALPGDLESVLVMMAVIGVQLVAPPRGFAHRVLPFHGASQLLRRSNNAFVSLEWPIVSLIVWFVALATATVWTSRTTLHTSVGG